MNKPDQAEPVRPRTCRIMTTRNDTHGKQVKVDGELRQISQNIQHINEMNKLSQSWPTVRGIFRNMTMRNVNERKQAQFTNKRAKSIRISVPFIETTNLINLAQ